LIIFGQGGSLRLDYDELRKIYRLEKNNSRLAPVEDDFLDSLKEFFEAQRKDYLQSLNDLSSTKAKSFSNLKKIVGEIFSVREKKLLNKALIASRTGGLEAEPLASQEKETLDELLEVLNRHQEIIEEIFNGRAKKGVGSAEKVSLRVVQEVPAFMGADMKEYGPFSRDKVVSVPEKIASLLVSRKLAEKA
jgi:DNA replication initiation complex subunit (GINS family)